MKLANLGGRAVLIERSRCHRRRRRRPVGVFGPDPQALFEDWPAFVGWAARRCGCRAASASHFEAELGAPVPRPRQVFAIGLNYAEHAAEAGYPPDSMPVTFTKFPSSIVGPDTVVELPEGNVDWEVELVVVIGREAHKVDRDERLGSRRRASRSGRTSRSGSRRCRAPRRSSASANRSPASGRRGPGWSRPTSSPTATTSRSRAACRARRMQSSRTSMMLYDVPELLVRLSAVCPLLPGDIIFIGHAVGHRQPRARRSGSSARTTYSSARSRASAR